MRRIVVAMMVAMAAGSAQAADLPDLTDLPILRGGFRDGLSTGTRNWRGFYAGVQYGGSNSDFGNPGVNAPLRSLAVDIPNSNTNITTTMVPDKSTTSSIGGFVGYNWQWDDAVLGIDGNYSAGGQRGLARFDDSNLTTPATIATASMKITDYGAIRARAGWAVGSFLPYVTGGVALGRADMVRMVSVDGVGAAQAKNGAFIYGYSFGGGLDVALFKGLFARGEVEVTRFVSTWGMDATVTTARGGIGYRF